MIIKNKITPHVRTTDCSLRCGNCSLIGDDQETQMKIILFKEHNISIYNMETYCGFSFFGRTIFNLKLFEGEIHNIYEIFSKRLSCHCRLWVLF
jgi:hypothetical protein